MKPAFGIKNAFSVISFNLGTVFEFFYRRFTQSRQQRQDICFDFFTTIMDICIFSHDKITNNEERKRIYGKPEIPVKTDSGQQRYRTSSLRYFIKI
jgi:hypothetical protein